MHSKLAYFAAATILFLWCNSLHAQLSEIFYDNGQLKESGNKVAGKKEGPRKLYFENRTLQALMHFSSDLSQGPSNLYYKMVRKKQKAPTNMVFK